MGGIALLRGVSKTMPQLQSVLEVSSLERVLEELQLEKMVVGLRMLVRKLQDLALHHMLGE